MHLEVKVRRTTGRVAGCAYGSEHVAGRDSLAAGNGAAVQVRADELVASLIINDNDHVPAQRPRARHDDLPRHGCDDHRAVRRFNIDALVTSSAAVARIAEPADHRRAIGPDDGLKPSGYLRIGSTLTPWPAPCLRIPRRVAYF